MGINYKYVDFNILIQQVLDDMADPALYDAAKDYFDIHYKKETTYGK